VERVGVGQAYEITDAARLSGLAERMATPWTTGNGRTIAIPLELLSGWRFGPDDTP
jgi:hypothetical protein